MKKKKILSGVAVGAALAGVVLGGCSNAPFQEQDLYGPPPESDLVIESPTDEELSEIEALYGPPPQEDTSAESEAETQNAEETQPTEAERSNEETTTAMPLYGPPPAVS